jgi:7,8-didemethyl-8-hydroxy-5-deazariboflavin synthase CofG subunit
MPHHESPGKHPKVRIGTIEEAGRQKIPFTTGILVGIGQTEEEIARSLLKIGEIHEKYGHIQEVIIQRFIPKRGTPMESRPPPSTELMTKVISVARLILGRKMNIQIPPNIETEFELMIHSGANDLGGISPLTPDEINPEQPWCSENEIFKRISSIGYRAELRSPVYREFASEKYLTPRILERTLTWFKRFEDDAKLATS